MRLSIYLILSMIGLIFGSENLMGQKPTIKFKRYKKFAVESGSDNLRLKKQLETYFNKYGNCRREELFGLNSQAQLISKYKKLYSYDTKGRHLNTLEYNGDNLLEKEIKIYWDSKDNKNRVEEISYMDGLQTAVATTYLLEYDKYGNKKEEQYFDGDGKIIKKKVWGYNAQNEIIKSSTWIDEPNESNKEIKIVYRRNKAGDLQKSISKEYVNGKLFRKDIRFFKNNYIVRWKKYIKGKFASEFVNEYRDSMIIKQIKNEKRAKEETAIEQKGKDKNSIWVTHTEYDVYGNILISTQSMNEKVVLITQYAYDDYGNKTKIIKLNKQLGKKEEEQLAYDHWGNITRRRIFNNDNLVSEEQFEYEYARQKQVQDE